MVNPNECAFIKIIAVTFYLCHIFTTLNDKNKGMGAGFTRFYGLFDASFIDVFPTRLFMHICFMLRHI